MNRFSHKVIIISKNLDGFSLANHGRFAKLSHYTVQVNLKFAVDRNIRLFGAMLKAGTEPIGVRVTFKNCSAFILDTFN